MPQVTIKFEDQPDGNVSLEVKCNPDITEHTKPSGAQKMAMAAMEYLQFIASGGQMPTADDECCGSDHEGCCGPEEASTQPAVKPKPKSQIWTP